MEAHKSRYRRRGRPRGNRLAREITIIVVFKLILLAGIWYAFFSKPPGASLGPAGVAQALLGDASAQRDGGVQ